MTPSDPEPLSPRRALATSAALLWAPALPLAVVEAPTLALLGWWSLTAAPAGALLRGGPRWGVLIAPALGAGLVGLTSPDLAHPLASLAALACLHVLGWLLGSSRSRWTRAALLWALGGLLTALPSGAGLLARPFPPAVTATLLDLSPEVWVVEVGGLDWARHPAVYDRAGAGDLGPDQRVPRRPASAYAALALVCALAAARAGLRARHR